MQKRVVLLGVTGYALAAVAAQGATASFTPVGPTSVEAGTIVVFEATVSVGSLSGFDTADVIIGCDGSNDLGFTYSGAWMAAFANVTAPVFDNGVYSHDVFVGGNHTASVGASLLLGEVTIHTAGMAPGDYIVAINHARDGLSTLGLAGVPEALSGSATFTITPPVPAVSEWGLATMCLLIMCSGTILMQRRCEAGT